MKELRPMQQSETAISVILRAGLILAVIFTLFGGCLFLWQHGDEIVSYQLFKGEPERLKRVDSIIQEAISMDGLGIIQLGILFLIATPIVRVVSCMVFFAMERDMLYTAIAFIVLLLLFFSFFWGFLFLQK